MDVSYRGATTGADRAGVPLIVSSPLAVASPILSHERVAIIVVGVRGDDTFDTLAGLLSRGNAWATAAGALILVCADQGEDEKTSLYCGVDAGAAAANLSIEAVSRGLISHPMAGFDVDGSRPAFGIPPEVLPLMVIAVGSPGDYGQASAEIAERDVMPRKRLPLDQIAFSQTWGQPWR